MPTRISQRLDFSAAADLSRVPQQRQTAQQSGTVVEVTTISFTAPATISDSGNGLGAFRAGDKIEVRGGANARTWIVGTAAAGALTVRPGRIVTASAGPTISVRKVD